MDLRPNISLVVVCGIPGCGKSTLCSELLKLSSIELTFVHVCFDRIICNQQGLLFNADTAVDGAKLWKKERNRVAEALNRIVEEMLDQHDPAQNYSTDLHDAFQFLKIPIDLIRDNVAKNVIVLLDDNFYYSSMRQPYYNMARKFGTGFGQIHMSCSLDTCISRNLARSRDTNSDFVPSNIIVKMHDKFEVPGLHNQQENLAAEKHVMRVDSEASFSKECLQSILAFCQQLSQCPVDKIDKELLEQSVREQELSRSETLNSIVHQADLLLRKCIGRILQKNQSTNRSMLSKAKSHLLCQVRSGALRMDTEELARSILDNYLNVLNMSNIIGE